ncbi:DNA repair protein RadA [Actinopolymorpha pittospori]|uniref:DNA repair protein RadA n=1 Tax=Actinopolymorpha pittospori TaxID=648752 RepID=A0A927N146_9ACTN|nr:DNA repair protein RadA [Actinopolymorpha pittospori]MBE1606790.1 DNA repair protein RadA/Sms [Actinopolymorpha pittospori]
MARSSTSRAPRPAYRCGECGWQTTKWVGRCGECQAWGTVEEIGAGRASSVVTAARPVSQPATPIDQVSVEAARAEPTGISELDRVLGGGLVPGAVVLVAGEPGVGKSTLLLEAAAQRARSGGKSLYLSGEESAAQIRLRAERIDALAPRLFLAAETDLGAVLSHIDDVRPDLIVLDSVQTVASAEVDGAPGGVTQVREVAGALIRVAKERNIATLVVGHVTKDGSIAGPRALEHLVDVVLHFEGERHSRLRMVRAVKNRYGPTDEVGCFDFADGGLESLPDPSGLFLTRRGAPVSGSCVTATVEGKRPLLAEVQALVAASSLATPRRATSGLDSSRLAMILAVLERRAGVSIGRQDVYAATVGGVRLREPASDLAVALAIASADVLQPLPVNLIAVGEVGLGGDIRRVTGIQRRLSEAFRLGFTYALVPLDGGPGPEGMEVRQVAHIGAALDAAARLGKVVALRRSPQ